MWAAERNILSTKTNLFMWLTRFYSCFFSRVVVCKTRAISVVDHAQFVSKPRYKHRRSDRPRKLRWETYTERYQRRSGRLPSTSESFSLRDSVPACIDIGSPKAGRLIRSRYSLASGFRHGVLVAGRASWIERFYENERLSRPRKYPIKNVLAE